MTFSEVPESHLYAIANIDSLLDPLGYVKTLLQGGIGLLQIRSKALSSGDLQTFARNSLRLRDEHAPEARIIINDSIEVCKAVGADGVHLGQGDSPPTAARMALGPDALIGLSTHNEEQLQAATQLPLDYLALGPIFLSSTKQGHAAVVGLETLASCAAQCAFPVVAIGGITSNLAEQVYSAGAASVAVISDLQEAAEQSATELKNRITAFRVAKEGSGT